MSGDLFVRVRDGLRLRNIGYRRLQALQRQGHRVGFVNTGDNIYIAGDQEGITQFVDNPTFESIEDVIEFERETHNPGEIGEFEEIELNDFDEINTAEFAESLPLAEAGGIAGTTAASGTGVSTSAIVTGTAIVGGTIVIGTTAGILSNRDSSDDPVLDEHKNPIVSIPDHKYIGPGNTVDDTPPVDLDDEIAREHDIRYENAQSQDEVQEADKEAAGEFLTDVIHNNNPHSILGYIGLKAKEKVESAIGVQYPANLPVNSPSGMSHHVSRRAIPKFPVNADPRSSPNWRRRGTFPSESAYKNWVKFTWSQWNVARQNRGLRRVLPPSRLGIAVTQRPRTGNPNNAMSFNEFRSSDQYEPQDWNEYSDDDLVEIDDTNMPRQPSIAEAMNNAVRRQQELNSANLGHRVHNDNELNDIVESGILDNIDEIVPMDEFNPDGGNISSSDGAGSSNQIETPTMAATGNANKRARTDAGPSDAGVTLSASGASMSSGADGGFDSTSGPDDTLFQGGYSSRPGSLSFTKVHELTIEAIPYTKIDSATFQSGALLTVTPLARIDWDMPYFYLSEEDFNKIPAGSYFNNCSVDIMGITYPTGYPTGGTTASVSSTNHAKILMAALDIEKKNRGGTDVLVTTVSNEMVPTAINTNVTTQVDDFIKKQYGTDQTEEDTDFVVAGCATDIPYRLRKFWAIYQPNKAQAALRGFTDSTAPGQEYFRNYIKQVNANNFVWDKDVLQALVGSRSLNYKFVSAPIGDQFKHMEIQTNDVTSQAVGSGENYNILRSVTNAKPGGNLTVTETIVASSRNTYPKVSYKNRIEQGATFVKGDRPHPPARQPSFHIGMKAIEKFDPTDTGSRAKTFVQARMTIHVKATIHVTLPQYPDRFIRSKAYNTTMEAAVAGIGRYQNGRENNLITFGLASTIATAPTSDAIDEANEKETPIRNLPSAVIPSRVTRSSSNVRPRPNF